MGKERFKGGIEEQQNTWDIEGQERTVGAKQERGQGDEEEKWVAGAGWETNHNKIGMEMP